VIAWGKQPGERAGRIAERIATAVIVFYALYFGGHVIAAWLRGSFEVIAR
jgi:hypothetical protein